MPTRAGLLLLTIATVAAGALGCGGDEDGDVTTLRVVEHADTNTVQHVGPADEKDSVGDVLGYANPIYDASDEHRVGSDNGYCIRTVTGPDGAWECAWTTTLEGGQLMVAGPFLDGKDSVNTITGGTGSYAGASGEMDLGYRNPKGTEYDFVFHIEETGDGN